MATLVNGSSSKSTTTYTYGEAEQTLSMSSSIVGGGTTSFTYDAVGRPATQQDPNGQKTAFTFNPDDTLASRTLSNPSGSSVAAFTYAYDGNFQITSQTFTGEGNKQGKQAYTYDKAGRLASFTDGANPTQQVTFDHDGNRLSVGTNNGSSTYNPDDTLASITDNTGTVHPQIYTFRGDLYNDGCFSYTYDGFDRMTSVSPTGAAGCPSTPGTTYTYDGLDRQRTTGSTTLHYDGTSSLVSVETSSSATDTAYEITPDGKAGAVAVQSPAAGPAQYLSDDGQGNITTVTSSTGALTCSVRYDPWGSPLAAQSPQNPCDAGSTINDHFYRGQRLDPVTGNYQLGNRAYSPRKASFINPDTYRIAPPSTDLGVQADPLTQNRYAYVNGDPVNLYDPTGHCGSWWNPSSWGCQAAQAYHAAKQWVQQQVNNGVQTVKQVWHDAQQTVGNAVTTVTGGGLGRPVQHLGLGEPLVQPGRTGARYRYRRAHRPGRRRRWRGARSGRRPGLERCGQQGPGPGGRRGRRGLGELGGQAESSGVREALASRAASEEAQPTLAEACAVNSFAASTPVLMADGTEKQIKDVKVGDQVKATDPRPARASPNLSNGSSSARA